VLTHKYVDDTTVSEILARGEVGRMQSTLDKLNAWSDSNYNYITVTKLKK